MATDDRGTTIEANPEEALRRDALNIARSAIAAVQPDAAVAEHLRRRPAGERYLALAVGKAAWGMAHAARSVLGGRIERGIVITKYGHVRGPIEGFEIHEAGHPLLDTNSLAATRRALELVDNRPRGVEILLLLSGGGSALFEHLPPGVALADLQSINNRLLRAGAAITELNAVRKHLSLVKGGRLAERAAPSRVITLALSDVLGDPLDAIASGPAWPDASTSAEAQAVLKRYRVDVPPAVRQALGRETPKKLENVEAHVIGSVTLACQAAAKAAGPLGYRTRILTDTLEGEAAAAGRRFGTLAREAVQEAVPNAAPVAMIAGGETVVQVRGAGKGGRNQELALAAAAEIRGLAGVVVASVGTDGTDGPTDAAGGLVDGGTAGRLEQQGIRIEAALADNDAYHALKAGGDLIITGPTGTNVNDLILILIRGTRMNGEWVDG